MGDNEYEAFSNMNAEFNTKIADVEGKYEFLRERMMLSNESFIKSRVSRKDTFFFKNIIKPACSIIHSVRLQN